LFWLNGGGFTIVGLHQAVSETHTEENSMATMSAPSKLTEMNAPTKPAQLHVTRRSPAYWRVTIDNPPINVMGPEMVKQFQEVISTLEDDEQVRVVVFDSAVDDYFLNHSDFNAKLEDLTGMPAGPTGLPPWPDFLARLTRLPVASIALIRDPHQSLYIVISDGGKARFLSRSIASGVRAPGIRGGGQREMKTCSAGSVVRSPEPATVRLNNRSADTKAHPGAVFLGRKESVEYLAGLVRRKSDASVFDRYQKLFLAFIPRAECELTLAIDGLHRFDAVDHQVH
jgi:hypothetical protein